MQKNNPEFYHHNNDAVDMVKFADNYFKTGAKGSAERRIIIEGEVAFLLKACDTEKINAYLAKFPSHAKFEQEIKFPGGQKEFESCVQNAFQTIPEWIQVLAHDRGVYIGSRLTFPAAGMAFGGFDNNIPGVFGIALVPSHDQMTDPLFMARTIREEMTHDLQAHADFYKGFNKIPAAVEAVATLLYDLDHNPDHPAFALMDKTDPREESSLMYFGRTPLPDIASYLHDGTMFNQRMHELMVDIYDAEIYLRNVEGKSAEQTKNELIKAFGEPVYNFSHQYVELWMNQAQECLAEKIGPQEAKRYRDKWEAASFTHKIELTDLPQYKLATPNQLNR